MLRVFFPGLLMMLFAIGGCSQNQADYSTDESDEPEVEIVVATETVWLNVPGMDCELGCVPAVQKALQSLDGVRDVQADVGTRVATLSVDPSKFNVQQAIDALEKAGYESKVTPRL